MQCKTVKVDNLSDLANQREIHDFFSFSGDIDSIDIQRESRQSKTAYVTFTEEKALEVALLLSGATLVDRIVTVSLAENYVPKTETDLRVDEDASTISHTEDVTTNAEVKTGKMYVSKAQGIVSNIIAKGSAFREDASAKATSFDKRVGLTEKFTLGISAVSEKVKSVDQKLHVSDKTMAAIFAAERKLNNTGSAVKSSRYVTAGSAWFGGAFSRVAKAGHVAGAKSRQKFNTAMSNLTSKFRFSFMTEIQHDLDPIAA